MGGSSCNMGFFQSLMLVGLGLSVAVSASSNESAVSPTKRPQLIKRETPTTTPTENISSSSSSSSQTTTTASTAAYRPRKPNTDMVLEFADLNDGQTLMIDDTNFKTLVRHCLKSENANACGGMAHWDVSRVKDCSLLFWEPVDHDESGDNWVLLKGADTFNVDISRWNTSSCTTMKSMFNGAVAFDQPIGNWNVERVTSMAHMFQGARMFNRDISAWKTHNVLDMQQMFRYASRFHNNVLSRWDTSRVTSMAYMFAQASHFNGEISWNVARVQHFQSMFHNADLFNQYIGDWDVSGAIDATEDKSYGFVSMFDRAGDFNQDVSHWDMRAATKLDFMFRDAYAFDQDISPWDIKYVTDMNDMFHHAKSFQQTLCWDLTGKSVGSIFEGTKNASAASNVSECWEGKHYFGTATGVAISGTDHEGNELSKIPPMAMRFLQAFLFAVAAALAGYWLFLVRQYLINQKEKQARIRKVADRASSRRQTLETFRGNMSDDNAEKDASYCSGYGEEGGNSDDDEDEEEILFEDPKQVEELRRNVFTASFAQIGRAQDSNMMSVEHAIPAMATLIQQEAYIQRLQEQRKQQEICSASQQHERRRSFVPGLSVRFAKKSSPVPQQQRTLDFDEDGTKKHVSGTDSNQPPLLDCIQIQVQDPRTSSIRTTPRLEIPPDSTRSIDDDASTYDMGESQFISRDNNNEHFLTKKHRVIRIPSRKLLKVSSSIGGSNKKQSKKSRIVMEAEAPQYEINPSSSSCSAGDGSICTSSNEDGRWVYHDVLDTGTTTLCNTSFDSYLKDNYRQQQQQQQPTTSSRQQGGSNDSIPVHTTDAHWA